MTWAEDKAGHRRAAVVAGRNLSADPGAKIEGRAEVLRISARHFPFDFGTDAINPGGIPPQPISRFTSSPANAHRPTFHFPLNQYTLNWQVFLGSSFFLGFGSRSSGGMDKITCSDVSN